MKLFAITRRGEKKDYMDIAILLQHYSLVELVDFYKRRHPANDPSVVVRFLTSFSDIERQPEPTMLVSYSWEEAKQVLSNAVRSYLT